MNLHRGSLTARPTIRIEDHVIVRLFTAPLEPLYRDPGCADRGSGLISSYDILQESGGVSVG